MKQIYFPKMYWKSFIEINEEMVPLFSTSEHPLGDENACCKKCIKIYISPISQLVFSNQCDSWITMKMGPLANSGLFTVMCIMCTVLFNRAGFK